MNIHHYRTSGGKDLILEYIKKLPTEEKKEGILILRKLEDDGLETLSIFNTRHLRGKLWEIKFYSNNRIMYLVADDENMYLIHACKKQKGRAELFELDTALKRVKRLEQEIDRRLIC